MPSWLSAILAFLFGTSSVGLLAFKLLKWAIEHPDEANLWAEKWYGRAKWFIAKADRGAVASGIQGHLARFASKANKTAGEVIPFALKVEWVQQATLESFLSNDEIIVRMDFHQNQARNLALAATHYVRLGLLHRAKNYVSSKLRTSIDLLVTQKILGEADGRALDYFLTNIMDPELENDAEVQAHLSKLVAIDEKGLFTSILLRQLADLSRRVYPAVPTEELRREVTGFVDYLVRIAQRARGERLGDHLGYIARHIRCAVVLLAMTNKIGELGTMPYRWRAEDWFARGAEVVYFLAWEPHLEAARSVCEELRGHPNVDILLENRFWVRHQTRDQEYSCIMVTTKIKANVEQTTPGFIVDADAIQVTHEATGTNLV